MTAAYLLVPEVAEQLRKSERFVRDELKRRNLVGSYFGNAWHVEQSALDAYVAAHQNVTPVKRRRSA